MPWPNCWAGWASPGNGRSAFRPRRTRRRGERRTLKCNHGRANVTLNGALAWPSRAVVTREAKRITGDEMVALLRDLAARHPMAEQVTVVLDNATYNRAATVRGWLAEPGCRVRLVYLPPYAPNLNLIERLWWYFKKKTLWNVHHPSFAAFRAAILDVFNTLDTRTAELTSLITDKFHFIGEETAQVPQA